VELAEITAGKAKRPDLVSRAIVLRKDLEVLEVRARSARLAAVELANDPRNAAANAEAGRHWCLVRNNWAAGLTLLAAGNDEALREVAAADLAGPQSADGQVEVGHRWWSIADAHEGLVRRNARSRAVMWYRKAERRLTGLSRTLVGQRLAEWDDEQARLAGLARGLHAELFAGEHFEQRVIVRIDPTIDFDWGLDAAGPGVPKEHFSARWNGWIRVPRAGQYTFVVIANSRAALRVDEEVVLDEPDLTRRRNGARAGVELSEGFIPIGVEFADGTGTAKMRLLWILPSSTVEEPVPEDALYHDEPPR
jgi:hypothetical protein